MKSLFNRWSYCTLWGGGWDDPHEVACIANEKSYIRGRDLGLRIARREQRCGFTGVLVAGTVVSTTDPMRSLRGERWFAVSFTIAGGEAPAFE